jgi:hypothetical protein
MLTGTSFAGTEISLRDFTTATLMHGTDLLHGFDAHRFPYDLGWGFGNYTGRSASDRGWRGVLAAGHISAAVPLPLSKQPPLPAQVEIRGGNRRIGQGPIGPRPSW